MDTKSVIEAKQGYEVKNKTSEWKLKTKNSIFHLAKQKQYIRGCSLN